jgi:nicotinate-nucleotide pyrophosphorylase (carboxylating)
MPVTTPNLPDDIELTVRRALDEDIGSGDVTAALIPPMAPARATVVVREDAVLCGTAWFESVFEHLDPGIQIQWHATDGQDVHADSLVCTLAGNARALLTGERTALNLLQTLSGTATVARRYGEAVAGTGCRVLDTRKTVPGLRKAQKYAAACGGVTNHRIGLFDAILIKENHIFAAGSIPAAIEAARRASPTLSVEVEVEDLEQAATALEAGADTLLLDNFDCEQLAAAVALNLELRQPPARLEASGNVTLETLPAIAATGVHFVSVGAITKHVRAVDLSMRFEFDPI